MASSRAGRGPGRSGRGPLCLVFGRGTVGRGCWTICSRSVGVGSGRCPGVGDPRGWRVWGREAPHEVSTTDTPKTISPWLGNRGNHPARRPANHMIRGQCSGDRCHCIHNSIVPGYQSRDRWLLFRATHGRRFRNLRIHRTVCEFRIPWCFLITYPIVLLPVGSGRVAVPDN